MAKVLISTLGTGRLNKDQRAKREYDETEYRFGEVKKKTSFFAAFLQEYLKADKIILIGTAKSMREEVYRFFCNLNNLSFDEAYYFRLAEWIEHASAKTKISEFDLTPVEQAIGPGSKIVLINYGITEDEIWQNMEMLWEINQFLEDGDEIYVDITHSFRSLSFLVFLMLNYFLQLDQRSLPLKGIFYGMVDVVRELGYAPVVDLLPLFTLIQWIQGTREFLHYGNGYLIRDLIMTDSEIVAKRIKTISDAINLNYLSTIKEYLQKPIIEDAGLTKNKPFSFFRSHLEEFFNRFKNIKTNSDFQLELSAWFYEHKRFATAYITLHESILTFMCELEGNDPFEYDSRERMKSKLYEFDRKKSDPQFKELAYLYHNITKIRNNIAHNLPNRKDNFLNDITIFKNYHQKVKRIYRQIRSD